MLENSPNVSSAGTHGYNEMHRVGRMNQNPKLIGLTHNQKRAVPATHP